MAVQTDNLNDSPIAMTIEVTLGGACVEWAVLNDNIHDWRTILAVVLHSCCHTHQISIVFWLANFMHTASSLSLEKHVFCIMLPSYVSTWIMNDLFLALFSLLFFKWYVYERGTLWYCVAAVSNFSAANTSQSALSHGGSRVLRSLFSCIIIISLSLSLPF